MVTHKAERRNNVVDEHGCDGDESLRGRPLIHPRRGTPAAHLSCC
jgi:hypothetical protein